MEIEWQIIKEHGWYFLYHFCKDKKRWIAATIYDTKTHSSYTSNSLTCICGKEVPKETLLQLQLLRGY